MLGFSAVFAIVVATLLIIEMTVPQPHPDFSMDLAKARSAVSMPAAVRRDALTLYIWRDGTVFLSDEKVQPNCLANKIRERLNNHAEKKVYIKADRLVRYGAVVEVLNGVRDAGIQNVAFIVYQRY
jgi:biopolymer transport protein ExbD